MEQIVVEANEAEYSHSEARLEVLLPLVHPIRNEKQCLRRTLTNRRSLCEGESQWAMLRELDCVLLPVLRSSLGMEMQGK